MNGEEVKYDSEYFAKLIKYINYWSSDLYNNCKLDILGNKVIDIDKSITNNHSKFIHHIKIYIDSAKDFEEGLFPLLWFSNDRQSLKIAPKSSQKKEWVCPFVIHNPFPVIKKDPEKQVIQKRKPIIKDGRSDKLLFE